VRSFVAPRQRTSGLLCALACALWRDRGSRPDTNKGKTLKLLVPVGQLNQRPAIRVFAGPINGGCFVRR